MNRRRRSNNSNRRPKNAAEKNNSSTIESSAQLQSACRDFKNKLLSENSSVESVLTSRNSDFQIENDSGKRVPIPREGGQSESNTGVERQDVEVNLNVKYTNRGGILGIRHDEQMQTCDIMSLLDDVLLMIFRYLDQSDLCKLSLVCKRFNYLSSKDCVWSHHAEKTVLIQLRHDRTCSYKEKCRLAPHWIKREFKDRFITKHKVKQIPWLQKDDKDIWFSSGNVIRNFKCKLGGSHVKENKNGCLLGLQYDASRFIVKNGMIVAGSRDGSVVGWKTSGELLFCHKEIHQSDTHCVDFTNRCVISGSKDGTCKVMPLNVQKGSGSICQHSFNAGERVWCLQASPCQRFVVAGLAGYLNQPPLVKWDIESGALLGHFRCNLRRGAAVLDMKFESENELLTCGYDTFIRLWDTRTYQCVAQWEEPYDSSLYSLCTDGANAIAVGTARHGMVRLWDKRKTEPVQMYYSTVASGPVYSLAMSHGHLYLALDMGLTVMDFT